MRDMAGQRAVVTGAARGIGLAIAEKLAALGVAVEGWDILAPEGDCFAAFRSVDVTDEAAVDAAMEAAGSIEILVNNAGINGPTKPTWEYTLAEWSRVLDVDLTGVFLCSRAAAPGMRARGYGRIVQIASIAGKEGGPNACAYAAAKHGVVGFTKGLAQELVGSGVLANCIAPVMTETDLLKNMSDDYIADRRRRIPMGRFCTTGEIAEMAAWVASPACSFTTGAVFDISGGRATY